MSLSTRIAAHLTYLRRYARAVTGSQTSGDAGDGSGRGIFGRTFDANGTPEAGDEFIVVQVAGGDQPTAAAELGQLLRIELVLGAGVQKDGTVKVRFDLDERAAFESGQPGQSPGGGPDGAPSVDALDPAAANAALSVARSLLALLESDLVVSHGEACVGLERLAASGRAGRAAACQVGCVLPLMAAALAGNPKQRGLAMEALEALTIGTRDNSPGERTRAAAAAARGADDVVGGASDAPMDADDDDAAAGGGTNRRRLRALEAAVDLSVRYIPDNRLPDKALDLFDEAGARQRLNESDRVRVGDLEAVAASIWTPLCLD